MWSAHFVAFFGQFSDAGETLPVCLWLVLLKIVKEILGWNPPLALF